MDGAAQPDSFPPADVRLFGREAELVLFEQLLADAAAHHGGALVVRGRPGIGKTALLRALVHKAGRRGMQVLSAAGVETESHLPFAAIHQLLRPLSAEIGETAGLTPMHRRALLAALGLAEGQPDLYSVALATLELVVDRALRTPVVLALDDVHWFDAASADVLAFVARRVGTEAVLVVGTTRTVAVTDPQRRAGLPDIEVGQLTAADAAALLDARAPQLSASVRKRLLAEASGNPLALVELARTVQQDSFPGAPEGAFALNNRLEAAFAARAHDLDRRGHALLLALSADARCDTGRLLAAASDAGGEPVTIRDAQQAIDAGLVQLAGTRLRFSHPLMRSAVYQQAPVLDRLNTHRALAAQLTDHPDRRLWHLASATLGTDETLAAELEEYAEHTRARGGGGSAVAALRRAAELTDRPARITALVVRAAEVASEVGNRDEVEQLLASHDLSALGPIEQARLTNAIEVIRPAQYRDPLQRIRELTDIATAARDAGDPYMAMQLLWRAASRAFFQATGPETIDARTKIADLVDTLSADRGDPAALAIWAYTVPEERGAEVMQHLRRSSADESAPETMRFLGSAALVLGDFATSSAYLDFAVTAARRTGRFGLLARLLGASNYGRAWLGEWDKARAELNEAYAVAQETGEEFYLVATRASLANIKAMRGELDEARDLLKIATTHPLGAGMRYIQVAAAQAQGLVHLFEGAVHDAYQVLSLAFDPAHPTCHRYMRWWLVPELVDAALATDQADEARSLIAELPELAARVQAPILTVAAQYAAALLGPPQDADDAFDIAMSGELGRWPVYRARLQLHVGRRLRRRHQTIQARHHLRAARDTFDALGAAPWADAARKELRAAGENSRQRTTSARETLTPQELQIATLAAEGLTNRQIAERLFLSHRTVGSHLYRIYPRLGITRRGQLAAVLRPGQAPVPS